MRCFFFVFVLFLLFLLRLSHQLFQQWKGVPRQVCVLLPLPGAGRPELAGAVTPAGGGAAAEEEEEEEEEEG